MKPQNLTVTVAINTFNRPQDLSDCLNGLNRQTFKDFDILVINGGDREPVDKTAMNFPFPIKIIQQQKKGLVEARNLCWREAKTDIVCIIDDDLVVSPQWLTEIMATFLLDERIGGVSGPTIIPQERSSFRDAISLVQRFDSGSFLWAFIGFFYYNLIMEGKTKQVGKIVSSGTFTLGSNFHESLPKDHLIEVDYLEACNMSFRRALIEQTGGFDYCYTGTSEWSEPDLAFKIRQLGYRLVFNPKAFSEHHISQEGVFGARTYAFERSVNFITFYFRHIKPNTFNKILRFYAYLFFMNAYWCHKALKTRNMNWLTGLMGTAIGLGRHIL